MGARSRKNSQKFKKVFLIESKKILMYNAIPYGGELGSTFLLDSKAHAKIVITLVKRITKNLVAENDNYALAA